MIEKKDGIINEIVYDNTVYHNGEYRIYQSLPSLINVLEEIIKANVTTESLGITPFYRSACKKGQVEFDNKMFYLECRDDVSEDEYLRSVAMTEKKYQKILKKGFIFVNLMILLHLVNQ